MPGRSSRTAAIGYKERKPRYLNFRRKGLMSRKSLSSSGIGHIKRALELEKLGFKTMDSAHISYAERAADIMFTVDDDVLRVARIKRNQISVEIENPLRWLINVFQD